MTPAILLCLWLVLLLGGDRNVRGILCMLAFALVVLGATSCGAPCELKPCTVVTDKSRLCACGARTCTACLCDTVECRLGTSPLGYVATVDCTDGAREVGPVCAGGSP